MKKLVLAKKEKLIQMYRKHGKKTLVYIAVYLIIKWSVIFFLGSKILALF
jgi:hypothetical protein